MIACLEFLIDEGFPESREPVASVRAAIDALGECRRALDASRVWWDEDYSPYHIRWQHKANDGGPCRCDVCRARDAARAAMAKLGEGG